jgi:hypothetical protein
MTTEELIRNLASSPPVTHGVLQPPGARLLAYIAAAALAIFFVILSTLSRSPHLAHGLGATIAVTVAAATVLAAGAFRMSVVLSRPEANPRQTWIVVPLLIMVAGIAAEALQLPPQALPARLFGQDPLACLACVWLLSVPILVAALLAMRQGAPTRPRLAGAMAGLLAGAVTTALYTLHCPEDSLLFVATWHVPAILLVALTGAALAGRALKW